MNIAELISHLAGHAPAFAARLQQAGLEGSDILSRDDLVKIPVMRKDELLQNQATDPPFGGMLSGQPGELKRIFQSPGPIYEPEPRRADYWRWASALRSAGFQPGELVFNAFGYHLTPAGAMFEEGLGAVGCVVIPAGVGNQEQQIRLLHALGVTGYVGLPSYLKSLLDKSEQLGLQVKLDKAFVTAEPLPASLREELNSRGLRVRQGYGTAECGNLGYECEEQDGWHIPEDVIVQVCDINTGDALPDGETGEVVATLFNPDFALVRFGVGDLSAINREPCRCGRASPRLVGWLGRVGAAVKVRGMFLHPRQVADVITRFPEILAYQSVISRQEHRDELTLRIALQEGEVSEAVVQRLKTVGREAFKFKFAVQVLPPDAIPPGSPALVDERDWE